MISKQLTKEQQAARLAFARLLENTNLANQRYDSLPSSRGGKIISTDIARSLDSRYHDTPVGQSRDLVPGWDLALSNGWQVEIAYVFRDIELALYGAVERSSNEGRSVPLVNLPAVHRAVQQSVLHLIRRYQPGDRMAILLLHNTGAARVTGPSRFFQPIELAVGGALHYSSRHEAYYTEIAREIEALNPCG